jgi:hypothetical protein
VTQECFNQDVLEFDAEDARQRYAGQMNTGVEDPSDYIGTSASVRCDGPDADLKLEAPQIWSPPGSCCYGGGDCGNSNTSRTQNKRFVVPKVASGPEYKVRVRFACRPVVLPRGAMHASVDIHDGQLGGLLPRGLP